MEDVAASGGKGEPAGFAGIPPLLGPDDGTFDDARAYNAGSGPRGLVEGDSNGDGATDLAVVSYSGVRVLLGNGDGKFQTSPFT
jgi:hypothetical protein